MQHPLRQEPREFLFGQSRFSIRAFRHGGDMKRISILLSVFFTCFALAAWPQARPQSENKIVTFDAPGAGTGSGQGTIPIGPNVWGAIVGFYFDTNSVPHGFLRSPTNFTTFAPAGSRPPTPSASTQRGRSRETTFTRSACVTASYVRPTELSPRSTLRGPLAQSACLNDFGVIGGSTLRHRSAARFPARSRRRHHHVRRSGRRYRLRPRQLHGFLY